MDIVEKLRSVTGYANSTEDAADEIEKLRQCIKEWEEKAATWLASPEAVKRLDGYRELAQKLNVAEMQRDILLAELENIEDANWRKWDEEVRSPYEFVNWAQSRARHAIAKCKES